MKKLILSSVALAVILFLFSSCVKETKTELTDEQKATIVSEVEIQIDGIISAAIKLDADTYTDYFSRDEFISVNSGAHYFASRNEWADSVASWYSLTESRQSIQIERKVTVLKPDLVLSTRENNTETLLKSGEIKKTHGVFTQLWKKEQSGWKIIHYHESSKPITED